MRPNNGQKPWKIKEERNKNYWGMRGRKWFILAMHQNIIVLVFWLFFSWFLLENIIVLPKTRCFIYLNFSRLNIGPLILLSFWIWSMNLFFSNNFNLFSQYFFQYSSWLHLKWSLNLTFFSKSILVFLIFNYIANFIPFLFNSSPFYLWLHFSSPFILLHFLV